MVLLVTAKRLQSTVHHPNNLLNGFWEHLLINWQEWATLTFVYCPMSVGLMGLDRKRNCHRRADFSCALHGQNISVIHTESCLGLRPDLNLWCCWSLSSALMSCLILQRNHSSGCILIRYLILCKSIWWEERTHYQCNLKYAFVFLFWNGTDFKHWFVL